jgi:hypothetical protein
MQDFAAIKLSSQLGKAEIENLCLATRRYKDIGRLDVAMHDSIAVCRVQGIGDLDP